MTSATLFPLEVQAPAASGGGDAGSPGTALAESRAAGTPPPASGTTPGTTPGDGHDGPRRRTVASIRARTALTRQEGASARWFDWSANPYFDDSPWDLREARRSVRLRARGPRRGCEIGCGYCYARGTHTWLGHEAPRDFEDRIYVKEGFAAALRKDLRTRVRPGDHVAFGTATDPYQPVERRHGVMREALGELVRAEGLRVSITTKSSLVLRDVELLRAVARRNALRVNVTITTPDRRLARLLEPKAPPPGVRIATLARLRRAGVSAGVFLMPVLPGVTDAEADLRALFRAARDAGALSVTHQVVFLEGVARAHFLPLLRRRYPRVAARYEVWTHAGRNLPGDVRADVAQRVRSLLREHGLADVEAAAGLVPPTVASQVQRVFAFVAPAPSAARRGERIAPGAPRFEEVTA